MTTQPQFALSTLEPVSKPFRRGGQSHFAPAAYAKLGQSPTVLKLVLVLAGLALVSPSLAQPPLDFNRDIRPILSNKCFVCHGPDDGRREAGLRLDDAKIATHELESGATAIVPEKPDASELIRRISQADEAEGQNVESF